MYLRKFPDKVGIFLFDNAPSHKYPDDGLNANAMNVHPGGKQPVMRNTGMEMFRLLFFLMTDQRG